jgi:hypothetical protein
VCAMMREKGHEFRVCACVCVSVVVVLVVDMCVRVCVCYHTLSALVVIVVCFY